MALTVANVRTAISTVLKALSRYESGLQTSPDVLGQIEAARALVTTDYHGSYQEAAQAALNTYQAGLGSPVAPSVIRALLSPYWRAYAEALGLPAGITDDQIFDYVQDTLIAAGSNAAVKSRDLTLGTPTAFSPATKGVLRRLKVDRDDKNIEVANLEVMTFKCEKAFGETQRYLEQFSVRGAAANVWGTDRAGSGINTTITASGPDEGLLTNPRFASGTQGLSGWDCSDDTKVEKQSGTSYQYLPQRDPDATDYRLKITGTTRIYQTLAQGNIPRGTPMWLVFVLDRSTGTGVGTAEVELGAATKTYTLTALSSGYNLLVLDLDKNLYWDNFSSGKTQIEVALDLTISSGYVLVAHAGLWRMVQIRGQWYLVEAGPTPFVVGDSSTVTDALVSTDSCNQYYFQRAYGKHLRHNATPDWADA
jgi:hypothetical protein